MLDLNSLIWIDDQYDSGIGIPQCLGDRYLCHKNSLFRVTRDLFSAAGGTFEDSDLSPLGHKYRAAPLLCLADILQSKTVPYVSNALRLSEILSVNSTLCLAPEQLPRLIASNHVMHESCHCVSETLLGPGDEPDQIVAFALCSEAFANSMERVAMAEVLNGTDAVFFSMNTYVPFMKAAPVIRAGIEALGLPVVLSIAMLTYFCLNINPVSPPGPLLLASLRAIGLDPPAAEEARIIHLSHEVFRIKDAFREDTTSVYFRYRGLEREFTQLRARALDETLFADTQIVRNIAFHVNSVMSAHREFCSAGLV